MAGLSLLAVVALLLYETYPSAFQMVSSLVSGSGHGPAELPRLCIYQLSTICIAHNGVEAVRKRVMVISA